jgi:hypothetical protein
LSFCFILIVEYSSSQEKIVWRSLFSFFSFSRFFIDIESDLKRIDSCISSVNLEIILLVYLVTSQDL